VKCRAKTRQIFRRGFGPNGFVVGHNRVAFRAAHFDGNDLFRETSRRLCRSRFLLGAKRKVVLLLAANLPLRRDVFRRYAHVIIIESVPETVSDHGINHGHVAHFRSIA